MNRDCARSLTRGLGHGSTAICALMVRGDSIFFVTNLRIVGVELPQNQARNPRTMLVSSTSAPAARAISAVRPNRFSKLTPI